MSEKTFVTLAKSTLYLIVTLITTLVLTFIASSLLLDISPYVLFSSFFSSATVVAGFYTLLVNVSVWATTLWTLKIWNPIFHFSLLIFSIPVLHGCYLALSGLTAGYGLYYFIFLKTSS